MLDVHLEGGTGHDAEVNTVVRLRLAIHSRVPIQNVVVDLPDLELHRRIQAVQTPEFVIESSASSMPLTHSNGPQVT